jgi:hypothetical protein
MRIILIIAFIFYLNVDVEAQNNNIYQSQNFRLGDAHYRVAESTQIADTVLIWGDVQLPGVYLIPKGISLAQMIAYARGPINLRTTETDLDWSKIYVEININRYRSNEYINLKQDLNGSIDVEFFKLRIENYDTIIIRVRRKPNLLDYIRAYTPIVASVLNSFLLYRTIRDL